MGVAVVAGAGLVCSFGQGMASLSPTSQVKIRFGGMAAATIKDAQAVTNIASFGMCTSLLNPQVASATAAALGVLTPQPCMPNPVGTWRAAQTKCLASGAPCLTQDSTLMCAYGGCISIVNAGQTTVQIQ